MGRSQNPIYQGQQQPNAVTSQIAKPASPVVTEKLSVNDVIQTRVKANPIAQPSVICGKPVAPTVNTYADGNIQPFQIDGITGYQLTPQVSLEEIQGK